MSKAKRTVLVLGVALSAVWVSVTVFTVIRQHNRVDCLYEQPSDKWDSCTQNTKLEWMVKKAYLPFIDL